MTVNYWSFEDEKKMVWRIAVAAAQSVRQGETRISVAIAYDEVKASVRRFRDVSIHAATLSALEDYYKDTLAKDIPYVGCMRDPDFVPVMHDHHLVILTNQKSVVDSLAADVGKLLVDIECFGRHSSDHPAPMILEAAFCGSASLWWVSNETRNPIIERLKKAAQRDADSTGADQ